MKIYLTGKMRGIPGYNRAQFHYAAERLRAAGHEVYNPSEVSDKLFGVDVRNAKAQGMKDVGGEPETISRTVFALDLMRICTWADALAVMPNSESSAGAQAEIAVAHAIPMQVFALAELV